MSQELLDLIRPPYGNCACSIVNDYCSHGYKYEHHLLGVIYSRDGKSPRDAAKESVDRIFKRNITDNSSCKELK